MSMRHRNRSSIQGLGIVAMIGLLVSIPTNAWAAIYTYDFGTTTGTWSSGTSSSFLPSPPSGTSFVRVGTGGGSLALENPGSASLGTGSELVLTAPASTSVNKFSVFDYAGSNFYSLSFSTIISGNSGIFTFFTGNGASFSNASTFTGNESAASLRFGLGTSTISGSYRAVSTWTALSSLPLSKDSVMDFAMYGNNDASSTSYYRGGTNYSLPAGTWDLWIGNTLSGTNLSKAQLATGTVDSFMVYGESSGGNVGTLRLDNIVYGNELPAAPPAGNYWAPVAGGGGSGTWMTGGFTWATTTGTIGTGTQSGSGTLIFGNNSGAVTVSGSVSAIAGMQLSTSGYQFSGGTIALTGANTAANTITVDASVSGTISSFLTGSSGMSKAGGGSLSLSGSNGLRGGAILSAGTLRGGDNFAFGSGTLSLNGGTLTTGNDGAARSFANSVMIGGDVQFGDAAAIGVLTLSGSVDLGGGTRSLTVAQSTTLSGLVSNGGLIKTGGALLLLSSSNSYAAGTTVSSGTLKAGNVSSFGSGAVTLSAGATLDLNNLSVPNTITNDGGTITNASSYVGTSSVSGTADYSGAVGGTVMVDAGGVANFSGAINSLTVSAGGQANLNDGASLSQSTLTNNGLVAVNQSGNTTLSTAITGSGGFQKLGSGILTVTSNNTFMGATTVSAGTFKVDGSLGSGSLSVAANAWLMGTGTINGPVTVSGTLAPGSSPGVITLGSLVLTSTSTTLIEVAGTVRGTDYDGVNIAAGGGVTYGGILQFSFGASALPEGTYTIFDFTGPSSGSLASVESSGFYAGTWTPVGSGTYQIVKDAQTVTFSQSSGDVIVVPEPTTIALAAVGIGAMASAFWRRHRRA